MHRVTYSFSIVMSVSFFVLSTFSHAYKLQVCIELNIQYLIKDCIFQGKIYSSKINYLPISSVCSSASRIFKFPFYVLGNNGAQRTG
jgi:hypothetical protein